jgi:sigma-B regulation protein RsbU (phosphoserine phosphatase)
VSLPDEFVFRALSIPFLCLSAGLLALVVAVMLRRGDLVMRAGFISTGLVGIMWSLGIAATMCASHPEIAQLFARLYVGVVAFAGPSLLLLFLALSGIVAQFRFLLYAFTSLALLACLTTVATDWVIAGVWQTAWGIWYPRFGRLGLAHFALLALPMLVGLIAMYRVRNEHQIQRYRRYAGVVMVLIVATLSDLLLYHGVGVYPLSVVPGLVGVAFTLWSLFRGDLLHARGRGIDWGAVWEIGLIALLVPMIAVGAWVASRLPGPGASVVAILLLAPLYGAMQAVILIVRSYAASDGKPVLDNASEQALEEFGEMVKEPGSEADVGELLAELLGEHSRLGAVALHVVASPGTWKPATPDMPGPIEVAGAVETWLHEQRRPVLRRELGIRRLGKTREALLTVFERLGADVLIPMVERGRLVAVVAGTLPPGTRGLDLGDLALLRRATRAAARALIYLSLFREAMKRIEMAREVEVAATSSVTREPGEQRRLYDLCEIIVYHHAVRQVGGDWWSSHELEDGRVLVVMGEVSGHGVPTALVSATVAGACETALRMRGARIDLAELMELLDDAVRSVSGEHRYDMACFAALLDEHEVAYASAGHRAPWVCRRPMTGGREDELLALEASGARLGGPERAPIAAERFALAWNDIILICSESLWQASSLEGERYGERRLPRLLRRQGRAAGGRLCRVIIDDLLIHCGDRPVSEDLSMVAVRVGTGRSRRRARSSDSGAGGRATSEPG